ncbi:hypothetical protein Y1Q_0018193 [Alligator mississippiensis]|uniref:Endonuclease/exonuclease/phosphatase domain-containing protein n=1 Tax=Alligator mississippiensis TaxID=8496 RepID=A0A151MR59_ALLMI|nr:hypothetical protein Y1Q_0018193 [Alligator mississippiensis]
MHSIISMYAPTTINSDKVKNQFYNDLHCMIAAVPEFDSLILLGDFSAKIGSDYQAWDGVIGKHGSGSCNSYGLLLLRLCAEHELLVTNAVFHLPNQKMTSWMHPHFKHWHLNDYVIV